LTVALLLLFANLLSNAVLFTTDSLVSVVQSFHVLSNIFDLLDTELGGNRLAVMLLFICCAAL